MEPTMNTNHQTEEFCLQTPLLPLPQPWRSPKSSTLTLPPGFPLCTHQQRQHGSPEHLQIPGPRPLQPLPVITPQVLRQDLTAPWGYPDRVAVCLALVCLKGFFFPICQFLCFRISSKYHFLKEVFPEAPIPTPCLRYMHSHLLFQTWLSQHLKSTLQFFF